MGRVRQRHALEGAGGRVDRGGGVRARGEAVVDHGGQAVQYVIAVGDGDAIGVRRAHGVQIAGGVASVAPPLPAMAGDNVVTALGASAGQ